VPSQRPLRFSARGQAEDQARIQLAAHLRFVFHKPHLKAEVSEAVMCRDYRRSRCPRTPNCFLVLNHAAAAGASSLWLEAVWGRDRPFYFWSLLLYLPHRVRGSSANTSKTSYSTKSLHDLAEVQQVHRGRRWAVSTWAEATAQKDSGVRLQKSTRNKHPCLCWQETRFHPVAHNVKHEHPSHPGRGEDTEKG